MTAPRYWLDKVQMAFFSFLASMGLGLVLLTGMYLATVALLWVWRHLSGILQ